MKRFGRWSRLPPVVMSDYRQQPRALDAEGISKIREAFISAARCAVKAGFKVVEIHSEHGYLFHQFVSPVSNMHNDGYGGTLENRCRLTCEIVVGIKANLPPDCALAVQTSASDAADCSSGGPTGRASANRIAVSLGDQVPFAAAIRREFDIPTIAVGLILDGAQAETILADGDADLIAIGKSAPEDPN